MTSRTLALFSTIIYNCGDLVFKRSEQYMQIKKLSVETLLVQNQKESVSEIVKKSEKYIKLQETYFSEIFFLENSGSFLNSLLRIFQFLKNCDIFKPHYHARLTMSSTKCKKNEHFSYREIQTEM